VKTRQRNKIVFFIGLIVFISTIVTDTYYFAAHINPYTWYIPLGFFSFLVAIFFILSSEQTQIYHLSADRQAELQKIKDNLELLVVERTKQIEQQKTEIEKQNQLLTEKNNEISIKNTILNQQKEEITTQLHHLEKLNLELEINNKIIENQKQEIRQKLSDSIAKTIELKNETIKAQLKAITNQMNPHFIFNTLNAIKYFILQNDIKTSDLYLEKFAKLMRCTLYNSINETIVLKEEINTLVLYLELEQFRANKKFDFNIHIDDETILDFHKIPSLLIQPFVENSIIHGIRTLACDGKIELDFKIENDILICIVEDNGVGRQKPGEMKKHSEHISVGISLISQRLKLMSELYNGNYSFEYIDFQESTDGKTGTKVILKLPLFQ
jgi:LytS/YehU family sensor histidine kinase